MDFHPVSKKMRLKSVHPGTSLEEVQAKTGFDLLLPKEPVPNTKAPTQVQVDLTRKSIDPDGMRKREFRHHT